MVWSMGKEILQKLLLGSSHSPSLRTRSWLYSVSVTTSTRTRRTRRTSPKYIREECISRPADLGAWCINTNPTYKSLKKNAIIIPNRSKNLKWAKICMKMFKSPLKMSKLSPKCLKSAQKSAGVSFKVLLMAKYVGYTFKILLLVSKPTGHEVPRYLCVLVVLYFVKPLSSQM